MTSIDWSFSEGEMEIVQEIITAQEEDPFVQNRWAKNVKPSEMSIKEAQFWKAHLTALLTSQQRSGPESHVFQFVKNGIGTLNLERCREANDVSQFVSEALRKNGGIRYYNNIGDACEKNLTSLDAGGWNSLWNELNELIDIRSREPEAGDYAVERRVATFLSEGFVSDGFHQIGPKQARNVLQILGLTRFEIPLDSRITKWLNTNLDLPYEISGSGLNQPEFYHFVMDLVQELCWASNELPCIFDAAVFSSYDTSWSQRDAEIIF